MDKEMSIYVSDYLNHLKVLFSGLLVFRNSLIRDT